MEAVVFVPELVQREMNVEFYIVEDSVEQEAERCLKVVEGH